MSAVGYYRYKKKVTGNETIKLYSGETVKATACIKAIEHCENSRYIKFLDIHGRYRFYTFSEKWTSSNNPTQIGSYNNVVTSLAESLSATRNIGYIDTETIVLNAMIDSDDRRMLSDALISPRVYLKINDSWILVDKITGDGRIRNSDTVLSKFTISLEYAKHAITQV